MRLSVSYTLTNSLLPKDYRRGFASLIKGAIKNSNGELYESYYSTPHTLKPFTFSVYFPELVGQAGDHFNVGRQVALNFSTSSYELGTHLYNGLLALRMFPLFENTLILSHVNLRRPATITKDTAVFKNLAPVLINSKESRDWYLLPDQDGFNDGLNFAVREVSRTFLGIENASIEFRPIRVKRKVVRHYNMDMQGLSGVFELRSPPEVLTLVYEVGLGMRRSQGFGMLEVVR